MKYPKIAHFWQAQTIPSLCLLRYYIALSPMLYYFVLTNFWVGEGGIGAGAWILQAQPLYRIYSLNQINASKEIERNRPLSMNNIKEPAVYSVLPTGQKLPKIFCQSFYLLEIENTLPIFTTNIFKMRKYFKRNVMQFLNLFVANKEWLK